MRYLLFMVGLMLGLTGCPHDDPTPDAGPNVTDSGSNDDAGPNADGGVDAGVVGRLERPPILPRPPEGGLPVDLRPPR